jgi:hypothetical protein
MNIPTSFDILKIIQEYHKEAHRSNSPLEKDASCVQCNPINQIVTKNFKNFWNWISSEYNTTAFSNCSLTAFKLYLDSYRENAHNSNKTTKAAVALLYCLNYYLYPADLPSVLQHLLLVTHTTECFEKSFNTPILPLTPTPTTSKLTETTMNNEQLKNLIDHMTRSFKDIAKDIKNTPSGSGGHGGNATPKESNIITVKPFYGNDDEDPNDWIRSFEIAAEANNWSKARMLKIVPGYLHGLAAY